MTKQCSSCGGFCGKVCQRENLTQPEQEPKIGCVNHDCDQCKAQRKPLTYKAIAQVIDPMPKKMKGFMVDWDFYDFARAIEAAHGIKENT